MLDLVQILQSIGALPKVFLTLVLAGATLIFVNTITDTLIHYVRSRARRNDHVTRHLKPLLRATADLITRISDILILKKPAIIEAINDYDEDDVSRIKDLSPTEFFSNKHVTTAYRLIDFLAIAKYFGRQTAEISSSPRLDRIEYYLQHKILVGLRGNLYNFKIKSLNAAMQENLAISYLECDRSRRAADLSIGNFLSYLKEGKYDITLFKAALDFFDLDISKAKIEDRPNLESNEWKHTLNLAHLSVYLIDFYQELAVDPQWEEYRIYFVSLIRYWNASASKKLYLYQPGDLESNNYLDTFPTKWTSTQSIVGVQLSRIFRFLRISENKRLNRVKKRISLNYRGARFGKRHHPKKIRSWGLQIKTRHGYHKVRWDDSLETVYSTVKTYLRSRLLYLER
jgi:hypothetical protein